MDIEEKGTSKRNENRITAGCRYDSCIKTCHKIISTKNEHKVDIRKEDIETIWNRIKNK